MKYLPEQKIESFSQAAILYRNLRRPEVDILYQKANNSEFNKKQRKTLKYKASQLWRKIIIDSNKL
jgi:hypothetical protein